MFEDYCRRAYEDTKASHVREDGFMGGLVATNGLCGIAPKKCHASKTVWTGGRRGVFGVSTTNRKDSWECSIAEKGSGRKDQ